MLIWWVLQAVATGRSSMAMGYDNQAAFLQDYFSKPILRAQLYSDKPLSINTSPFVLYFHLASLLAKNPFNTATLSSNAPNHRSLSPSKPSTPAPSPNIFP